MDIKPGWRQWRKNKGFSWDLDTTYYNLILRAKITCDCLNARGTTVTGEVLAATEFSDLLCIRYDDTPPPPPPLHTHTHTISRANTAAVAHPSMYVKKLAAAKEASLLNVTKKCVTNSYTSLDNIYPNQLYAPNPSSTRDVADQIGRYVRRLKYWRHGMT